MKVTSFLPTVAAVLLILAVARPATAQWIPQRSGSGAELRGLSVVAPSVVWASGVRGTVTRTMDGETKVAKGLDGGETVVVDGQLLLIEGSKVEVREAKKGAS